MMVLASTPPDEMIVREAIDDGRDIGPILARALLDRIDELQRQLDEAPSQSYVDSLETYLAEAQNRATEARKALAEYKRKARVMVEALDEHGVARR